METISLETRTITPVVANTNIKGTASAPQVAIMTDGSSTKDTINEGKPADAASVIPVTSENDLDSLEKNKRNSTSPYFNLVTDVARKISFSGSTSSKDAIITKKPSTKARSTQNAIRSVLKSGVTVTCVAPWKDQVVPITNGYDA
jgi:hypothetical protein